MRQLFKEIVYNGQLIYVPEFARWIAVNSSGAVYVFDDKPKGYLTDTGFVIWAGTGMMSLAGYIEDEEFNPAETLQYIYEDDSENTTWH